LIWIAWVSLFCVCWIRKTIRNVTIVVPLFMISCHVSENPKSGPANTHITTTSTAIPKVEAQPDVP
jgi:hypothetical protein